MAAQAAYKKVVKVSTDDGSTWLDCPATSASLNQGGDVLDDTALGGDGFRSRLLGLHDWSVSLSIDFNGTNTGHAAIRDAWLNRSALMVQYLVDGTVANGFQGSVVVESLNLSGDIGAKETGDVSLQADGALAAAV